jgi:pimeloyl-ACP methyl ester carboxylesterase
MDDICRLPLPDGVTLTYRRWRAPPRNRRQTLVLLHGLASNRTRWGEFSDHTGLKRDWDILCPDLRGHGESPTTGKIGLEIWCDDLLRLLDAEDAGTAVFAGHSLGAQVAYRFACRYPARTAGLILLDPLHRPALRGWLRVASWLAPLLRGTAAAMRGLRLGLRQPRPLRDLQALDAATRTALAHRGAPGDIVRRYTSPLADLKYFPVAHYLQELAEIARPLPPPACIRLPVLALLSRGVTFTDPVRMRVWIGQFPAATLQAVDAWHWPLTERPAEVRAAVEDFCDRSARQRA